MFLCVYFPSVPCVLWPFVSPHSLLHRYFSVFFLQLLKRLVSSSFSRTFNFYIFSIIFKISSKSSIFKISEGLPTCFFCFSICHPFFSMIFLFQSGPLSCRRIMSRFLFFAPYVSTPCTSRSNFSGCLNRLAIYGFCLGPFHVVTPEIYHSVSLSWYFPRFLSFFLFRFLSLRQSEEFVSHLTLGRTFTKRRILRCTSISYHLQSFVH